MANVLQNVFNAGDQIAQTYTIESWHVSQSVDALTAAEAYDISISGSLSVEGTVEGGDGTSIASGPYSHAEGEDTQALGDYSHAEGQATQAVGDGSHAEGNITTSSGSYSHADGSNTIASGFGSHAEGYLATSSGQYSHAEGGGTIASGSY